MPKQQPKNVRKMVQHGSKFGPSWGHVGLQNRPGRVQGRKNASQRPLEKRIRKSIEKPRSGDAPGREVPDELGLHLGSILRPSGGHVWAMLAQKLILGGPGWLSKSTMKFDTFSNRFGSDFGSILGSKM